MVDVVNAPALQPGAFQSLRDDQVQNTLENQKIQASSLANASAGNIYSTQVLSAAAASNDPNILQAAKQHLNSMGVDTSGVANDIPTAQAQLQAARLAQSPLGSLLNASAKMDANTNTADIAAGKVPADPNATAHSLLRGALVQSYGPLGGVLFDQYAQPANSTPATTPTPAPTPAPKASANGPGMQLPGANQPAGSSPGQDATSALPQVNAPIRQVPTGATPSTPPPTGSQQGQPQGQVFSMPPEPSRSDPKYSNSNGNTEAANTALYEADDKIWNNLNAVKQGHSAAESAGSEQGKDAAEAQQAYNVMVSNIPGVAARTKQIVQLAPQASSGAFIDEQGNGWKPDLEQDLNVSPATVNATQQLKKIVSQEVLPGIPAALGSANIKGNRYMEMLTANSLGLNMKAPADTKILNSYQNVFNYATQLKATAQRMRDAGQNAMSDDQIDQMFAKNGIDIPKITAAVSAATPAQSAQAPAPGATLKTPSGISYSVVQ